MPIGVHFFGPDFREDLLFRAGFDFENATKNDAWRTIKPAAASNIFK